MTTPDPIRAVFSPPELQRLIVEAADAAAAAAEPDVDRILRLAAIIRYVDGNHDKGAAALAAAILSHPGALEVFAQPRPVPVAERLPGAEDCDAEGRCWLGASQNGTPNFAPKEPTTEDKKPLSLVYNCHMKGMPPNPHQDWQGYFDHCAATGTISGLRFEAIQPTPSINDTILPETTNHSTTPLQ